MKERKIKVFVSSTFLDMNEERDYLNNFIFPQITEYCQKRHIEFIPLDLRWGITEEESKNGLVLTTCMEEIDDSRPFFVGILGSRYGWIPTYEEVRKMRSSLSAQLPWIKSKVEESASITEIEMEYGALLSSYDTHACFFIRSSSVRIPEQFQERTGSIGERRLKALKERIRKQSKHPVYEYESKEQLGEIFLNEILKLIQEEFPETANESEEERISRHEHILAKRSATDFDLSRIEEHLKQWLASKKRFLYFVSEPGYGASTALCYMISHFRKISNRKIIYYDFELAEESDNIMEDMYYYMKFHEVQDNNGGDKVIVIDNCSILDTIDLKKLTKWIDALPERHSIIIGTSIRHNGYNILKYRFPGPEISINGLTLEQRREYIRNYIKRYGKKLTDKQCETLASSESISELPSLKALLYFLVNFGYIEELDRFIENSIDNTYRELWLLKQLIKLTEEVGLLDAYRKVTLSLALMGDMGIHKRDLQCLVELTRSQWAIIYPFIKQWTNACGDKILIRNGNWEHNWRHTIKNIWATPFQASWGLEMTDWYINTQPITKAAKAIARIFSHIWHLPIEDVANLDDVHNKIFYVAMSPEVVLTLEYNELAQIFEYLFISLSTISLERKVCYGRSVNELSQSEQIEYYIRLSRIANCFNRGKDEQYCYDCISEIMRRTDVAKADIYKALGLVAVGKANDGQKLISKHIPSENIFKKIFNRNTDDRDTQLLALYAQCKCATLTGNKKLCYQTLITTQNLINGTERQCNTEIIVEILGELMYYFSMFDTIQTAQYASLMLDKIDYDNKDITIPVTYKIFMAYSIMHMRANNLKNAELWAMWAGKSICLYCNSQYVTARYNILLTAIHYAITGEYIDGPFQRHWKCYNAPQNYIRTLESHIDKLKDISWSTVDDKFKKQILAERDFFRNLIYNIQPEVIRQKMDKEPDDLRESMFTPAR